MTLPQSGPAVGTSTGPAEHSSQHGSTSSAAGSGRRRRLPWWAEFPAMIVLGLVIALGVKTCLFQVFSIPSGSMENTLRVGDRVAVNKLAPLLGWEPKAGEPVVFKDPGGWLPVQPASGNAFSDAVGNTLSFVGLLPPTGDNYLVKRVIATAGETVQCTGSTLTVNGRKVSEPYLYPGDDSCAGMDFGPVTVSQGYVWVEGDHRSDSADSRYHQRGPGAGAVPVANVVGPASAVVWPLGHLDWFGWVGR